MVAHSLNILCEKKQKYRYTLQHERAAAGTVVVCLSPWLAPDNTTPDKDWWLMKTLLHFSNLNKVPLIYTLVCGHDMYDTDLVMEVVFVYSPDQWFPYGLYLGRALMWPLLPYIKASTTARLSPDRVGPPWIAEWPIILPAITNRSLSMRAADRAGTRWSLCPSNIVVTAAFPEQLQINMSSNPHTTCSIRCNKNTLLCKT